MLIWQLYFERTLTKPANDKKKTLNARRLWTYFHIRRPIGPITGPASANRRSESYACWFVSSRISFIYLLLINERVIFWASLVSVPHRRIHKRHWQSRLWTNIRNTCRFLESTYHRQPRNDFCVNICLNLSFLSIIATIIYIPSVIEHPVSTYKYTTV